MGLGKLMGEGATAFVYEYGESKVVKLARYANSFESITYEFNKMKFLYEHNVPSPAIYEWVEVDGRFGYVMEKYNGVTLKEKQDEVMKKALTSQISIKELKDSFLEDIKKTAQCLYHVHTITIEEGEQLSDMLQQEAESTPLLNLDLKKQVIRLIEELPKGNFVCHGDPNPYNIMICKDGYKLIDWVNAGTGNLLYDIAEYVWLSTPREENVIGKVPQMLVDFYLENKDLMIPCFLEEYKKLSLMDVSDYEPYMIPLLVRKLHSNRTMKEKDEIVIDIKKRLKDLYR